MNRWKGKVAVITGASAGIGAAIAQKLVEEGLIVVGFARRVERVNELAKKLVGQPGKLHSFKVDVTKEEEIFKGFKWVSDNLGPVTILINNAGILQNTTLIDGDSEKWKLIFDTNVLGLCIATREAVKIMRTNNLDGHIIHINSIQGHKVTFFPKVNVYSSSKFAVTALTETLRQEFNQIGSKIKITSISPGFVESEILEASGIDTSVYVNLPSLKSEDIADATAYVLSTPPHVQIHELTIKPIGEPF